MDEPVPRLPRGKGLKLSGPLMMRIAMTAVLLVAVIVMAKPCANSVATLVTSFGNGSGSGSGSGSAMPAPAAVSNPGFGSNYVQLRADMTEAELKAAIEQAKKNAAGSGAALQP